MLTRAHVAPRPFAQLPSTGPRGMSHVPELSQNPEMLGGERWEQGGEWTENAQTKSDDGERAIEEQRR